MLQSVRYMTSDVFNLVLGLCFVIWFCVICLGLVPNSLCHDRRISLHKCHLLNCQLQGLFFSTHDLKQNCVMKCYFEIYFMVKKPTSEHLFVELQCCQKLCWWTQVNTSHGDMKIIVCGECEERWACRTKLFPLLSIVTNNLFIWSEQQTHLI